jgi:predicted alpha/beta-hydrolase family hydrolase
MTISLSDMLIDGPDAGLVLVLAHGAGAPMDSPFMTRLARLLGERGIKVVRFEFAYMAARRSDGKRRPPSRMPALMDEFRDCISLLDADTVFIGGKSMGGRVASMLAAGPGFAGQITGLVCLGYPFHPPGKPESLRTAHLVDVSCPALIVQGERDPFGNKADVAAYDLPAGISVEWAPFGNHDLVPPKKSGRTDIENWTDAASAITGFMLNHST